MTNLPRTLILGAGGQVGAAMAHEAGSENSISVDLRAGPGIQYVLDLAKSGALSSQLAELLAATRPDVVINAAGMTWVDGCEADPRLAALLNDSAAREVARQTRRFGGTSVYFSTEYVFDGAAGPYSETDPARPLSVYGRTKLNGETGVLAVDPDSLVIRTTVVYGPEALGKNFAYQLAAALSSSTPIRVPSDQVSSPTYNVDLAAVTLALIRNRVSGICNVVGPELMDRATFARRLAHAIGGETGLIQSVPTAALEQRAPRPLKAGLRVDRLRSLLPHCHLRTPEEAVLHWRSRQTGKPWPALAGRADRQPVGAFQSQPPPDTPREVRRES